MRSDRSILAKIADTARDIVKIASDAADHALEPERPAARQDDPVTFSRTPKKLPKNPPRSLPRRRQAGIR
ncbi:MAG: hypothetical protein WA303_12525 [Bradyrhizobium sp.]|jgi:hypothetical protein